MSVQIGSAYGKVIIDSSGVRSGVDGATKSLSQFEKDTKTLTKGIATAFGFVSAEIVAMKKVFEFGREGAQVDQMERSFDTLLETMGLAPDLLEQLQAASKETISDYKLMSSTAILLAGTQGELATALAESTPRLLEMAKAAQKLNPDLGDTTFLYDSLARGIKRASPLILDNLGIIVKLEDAYGKYADSLGKSADQLTVEEQKIALLNEVLEQGDVLIQQAGGSVDSATDSFDRMTTAVTNATDAFKKWAADGLAPAADGITWLLTYQAKVDKALAEANKKLIYSTESYEDYARALIKNAALTRNIDDATLRAAENRIVEGRNVSALAKDYGGLSQEMWAYLRRAKDLESYVDGPLRSALAASERAVEGQTVAVQHAGKAANATREDMAKYSLELGRNAAAAREAEAAQKEMDQAMGDLKTMVGGELGEEFSNFSTTQDELAEKIETLKGKIEALEGKKYLTAAQKEELEEMRGELGELNTAYDENATAHEERTKRIMFDLLMERAAMDGLTSDELKLLSSVAEKWGLIDEDTKTAIGGIDEALNGLANGEPLALAEAKINGLWETVSKLEGDHEITFSTSISGPMPVIPGNGGLGVTNVMMASGGSFVVPPGFPDDSYIMGLTSGEQVDVTPAGGGGNGGGGVTNYITQTLNMSFGAGAGNNLRRDASRAAAITKALIWSD